MDEGTACHSAWSVAKRNGSAESMGAVSTLLWSLVVVVIVSGRFVARGNPEANMPLSFQKQRPLTLPSPARGEGKRKTTTAFKYPSCFASPRRTSSDPKRGITTSEFLDCRGATTRPSQWRQRPRLTTTTNRQTAFKYPVASRHPFSTKRGITTTTTAKR
jgi:hypothetical protein